MTICLNIGVDEKLMSGLSFAFAILDKIQKTEDEEVIIDFSKTSFVSPTFVLPLFICLKESKKHISLKGMSTYLYTICFERGYIADNMRIQSFVADIERYKENKDIDIATDLEAIRAANRGISTKNLPEAENRGYGIITSKKMLIDGLCGAVIMLSGSAMSIYSNIDEYYNVFIKSNDQLNHIKVATINIPEDIKAVFLAVSRTQNGEKKETLQTSTIQSFTSVTELNKFLSSLMI